MQTILDNTTNIQALTGDIYERIGSLVFWEFPDKRSIKHDFKEIYDIFASTQLSGYLSPVVLSECIRRFADSVVMSHGNLLNDRQLNYLVEKDKNNPGYYYLSFYTGKVDDKKSTNFIEHAKIWIGEDGNNIALLDKDDKFLIQSWDELSREFEPHWKIIHKDVINALGFFANSVGYRFTSHGGHYFVPHKYTEELYKIKNILKQFNQVFSITPLIAGCDEDIEEIITLLGGEFKKELDTADKELFEMCINIYGYHHHWDDYVDAVTYRAIEEVKLNKISKTKYGRKLTDKICKIDENASVTEYHAIIKDYIAGIKPNKNKSIAKIYAIRDRLKLALQKLDVVTESILINKWRNRLLGDLYQINQTLEKTSQLLLEETLSIL